MIVASIRRFGLRNPVLVDDDHQVIAGHDRLMAAAELKLETVPLLMLSGMTEAERRAYIIADNRLAECAGWDEARLASELAAIASFDPDFDLALTGFDGGKRPIADIRIVSRRNNRNATSRVIGTIAGACITTIILGILCALSAASR